VVAGLRRQARHRTALACAVLGALALFSAPGAGGAAPSLVIVSTNPGYSIDAVDAAGTAYGESRNTSLVNYKRTLFVSTDEGATWTKRFVFVRSILRMVPLESGALLAAIGTGPESLWRSTDGGLTWTKTFTFPSGYRTLTNHSVAEDGTYVYVGSYQTFTGNNTTNWVWRSADDGRTWSVVQTTNTHRHIHFVRANPYDGKVYVGFGDNKLQAGIDVSSDHGATWRTLCTGFRCKAVDIDFDPAGFAIYGMDVGNTTPYIVKLDLTTAQTTNLAAISCPAWSSINLGNGNWLIGEAREPGGTYCKAHGDANTHLWGVNAADGSVADVLAKPTTGTGYNIMRVTYRFPNGHFPVHVSGYGTIIGRLGP
jgi:hypothetical protein